MATYLGTHGSRIQNYTTDPDNPNTGEVWYNDTANTLKFQYPNVTSAGSWRTGANLNTARSQMGSAGKTGTAALAIGGSVPGASAVTESYNGTSWTEVNDLNTSTSENAADGTSTSALNFGGQRPPSETLLTSTESWNGTNWTAVNSMNTARRLLNGAGADNTQGLAIGGYIAGSSALSELYNGTNWTEVNDTNTARRNAAASGSSTSSLYYGGDTPNFAITELWNGTNWTEVNDLNSARRGLGGSGVDNTAALAFGGTTPGADYNALTEEYNGTNWTEVADLSTARTVLGGAGAASTSSLAFGGNISPGFSASTEEWTGAGAPVGAWSTGGNLNSARRVAAGAGTSYSAALMFGGTPAPLKAFTESYDGTSWTEVNDLNNGRRDIAGNGSQTAAIAFGGDVPPYSAYTETWNGTNWTEVNDMNANKAYVAASISGTTSATLAFGGYTGPPVSITAQTELWNGTNWTEVNDLNTAVANHGGLGISTSALSFGGSLPSTTAGTEQWNGTNWTEVANMNQSRNGLAGAGINTAGLAIDGNDPKSGKTEEWNGVSWKAVADLNTATTNPIGTGSATAALKAGGEDASDVTAATEEWNVPSTTVKTISTD